MTGRGWTALTALIALLSTATPSPVAAMTLEAQLVQALEARAGIAHGRELTATTFNQPVSCRYDARDGDRDRFCEPFQSRDAAPMNGCACREVCHVWGDPHLAPFFSTCSAHVMNSVGWHTLWELPDRETSKGMSIEGYVDKVNRALWIQRVRVDGEQVMDATIDCESAGIGKFRRGSRMLQSDQALAQGADPDTKIQWTVFCDLRKGVQTLEVSLEVEQVQSQYSDKLYAGKKVPETTPMFANDSGLCTNPGNKFNCQRPSEIKTNNGQEGRECTCNAQCSVFGDPHVHDFFAEQSQKGESFQIPKERNMAGSDFDVGRVLYMMDQRFAIYAKMNACEQIDKITVLVNKDFRQGLARNRCQPIGWDPEPAQLSLENFDILDYDAHDLCVNDADFASDTRKWVVFPYGENETQYLTEELGGFDLGFYGTWNTTDPANRPYRAAKVSRDTTLKSCKLPTGAQPKFTTFLDMGGVRLTMKCHRTRSTLTRRSTPFFNVCVERLDVHEGVTRNSETLSKRVFADAERSLLTSGHCALGKSNFDSVDNKYISTAHRSLDEFNFFEIEAQ